MTLLGRLARGRAKPAAVAPATDAAHAGRRREPRRLPRLMLLNLDPEADLGAVEHAAPLGSRGEVERRIAEVLPGFRVDPAGLRHLRGEDWSLALHLGGDENVWTVTVDVARRRIDRRARRTRRRDGLACVCAKARRLRDSLEHAARERR